MLKTADIVADVLCVSGMKLQKSVVLPAPAPSFNVYNGVGGKKELQPEYTAEEMQQVLEACAQCILAHIL